ncbi:GNAT family N-acetyltransferase [Solibacillus sp. MA9]|uniref:GNAT family N-acetyltransferase n=1 Tax=Solibacillus palustris TaxID=2908203 RepID=A0ABS9UFU9_9BACL|nr:GNAT family protein [Solibacillus sp. MA9]MCH7323219.1 GNAT family N-acetyltransferase [Solibacillus sp. MA9]
MVQLTGQNCSLRTFTPSDARALAQLLADNKFFWSTYEPLHREEFYTEGAQYQKILESLQLLQANREFSFGIFDHGSQRLIGHISLYSIKRLPYSSCFVGYSMDERYIGRGITTEAVRLLLEFGFNRLNIHRIEAYVAPQNIASIKVLEKSGFTREGLLRQLLFINGVWVDHYMYAILQDEYKKMN